MFRHLDDLVQASPDGALTSAEINAFSFEGRPVRLIVQTGIWKPAGLTAALTIRTTYTAPNRLPPYADDVGEEGLIRYKYRGTDPLLSDNRAMREAMTTGAKLAYFIGVAKGAYVPRYPVWIVDEDVGRHEFALPSTRASASSTFATSAHPRGRMSSASRARVFINQCFVRGCFVPTRNSAPSAAFVTPNFSTQLTSFPTASRTAIQSCRTDSRCARSTMQPTTAISSGSGPTTLSWRSHRDS